MKVRRGRDIGIASVMSACVRSSKSRLVQIDDQPYKLVSHMRKTSSVNYRNEVELLSNCPLAAAMKLIGGRWKIMLLWYVHHGIVRFSDLQKTIPHITEKMLYQQLREMERDILLLRVVEGRTVSYALTELGESLVPMLAGLAEWSERHRVGERLRAALTPLDQPDATVDRVEARGQV